MKKITTGAIFHCTAAQLCRNELQNNRYKNHHHVFFKILITTSHSFTLKLHLMLRFLFLFLFFGNVPLWGGVIVEYAVLTGDDVPDIVLPLLPQRVYAYIYDGHVAVRGEYLGSRLADYDLYPAGDAFRYECIGKNEATQHPLPVAEVLYTDDPPLTIARLPCRRALIVSELGDTSSVYFTDFKMNLFVENLEAIGKEAFSQIRGGVMWYEYQIETDKWVKALDAKYQYLAIPIEKRSEISKLHEQLTDGVEKKQLRDAAFQHLQNH